MRLIWWWGCFFWGGGVVVWSQLRAAHRVLVKVTRLHSSSNFLVEIWSGSLGPWADRRFWGLRVVPTYYVDTYLRVRDSVFLEIAKKKRRKFRPDDVAAARRRLKKWWRYCFWYIWWIGGGIIGGQTQAYVSQHLTAMLCLLAALPTFTSCYGIVPYLLATYHTY